MGLDMMCAVVIIDIEVKCILLLMAFNHSYLINGPNKYYVGTQKCYKLI